MISHLCKSGVKTGNYFDKKKNKNYKYHSLKSCSSPLFTQLQSVWYKNNKKIIPLTEIQKIEPLGLAIWFGDDGASIDPASRQIATMGFSIEENQLLIDLFEHKFNLFPKIRFNQRKEHYLSFTKNTMRNFIELIRPHLHASLLYKIENISKSARKFSEFQAKEIREKYKKGGCTMRSLAIEYNCNSATICATIHGSYSKRDNLEWQ
jgi:hypothetical protein